MNTVPDCRPLAQAAEATGRHGALLARQGRILLKVRTGPPSDDADDLDLAVWAGVLPLAVHRGPLEPDPQLAPEAEPPAHLIAWQPEKR